MAKEYEVKIINENINILKNKIKKLGASLVHPKICMRRSIFYRQGNKKNGFVRVREESNKNVKITCKQFGKSKYATEHEVAVNTDYETTVEFLKQCGNCKCFDIPNTKGVNTCEMCRTYYCNKCDNQLQNMGCDDETTHRFCSKCIKKYFSYR